MSNKTIASGNETNTKHKVVRCLNCLHAGLHRYGNNPVLSACHAQPQPENKKFPYQVEIASTPRKCSDWAFDPNEKTVEQRVKVA